MGYTYVMRHPRHPHHFVLSYPTSRLQRFYSFLLAPLIIVGVLYMLMSVFQVVPTRVGNVSFASMFVASLYTLTRILIAYLFALAAAVPLAILTTKSRALEGILLPVFDVLDSIPILAFFPVVILFFIHVHFLEGAAVFILFLNILWNIVFTTVGGLKIIPPDITYAARVFGLSGFAYFRRMLLPAIFPQLVTGSILAVAEAWNLIIVAEALHTYIPGGTPSQDLFGIGSMLVQAAANAQNTVFISSLVVMILFIAFFNFFVWQKLLRLSQRYRFE